MNSNRIAIGLILVLAFSATVRLVPTIYTGMPFSNDVWPLIYTAQAVSLTGRLPSVNEGGHHVNWPLSIIMSTMHSVVSGCDLTLFYQHVGVITVSTATTLLCYIIVDKLVKSKYVSLIASLGLTIWPSYTLYTSAFLKESFAHGIHLLLLYMLIRVETLKESRWLLLTLLVLFLPLLMSHPITSTVFAAFMLSYIYISVAQCTRWRVCRERSTLKYLMVTSIAIVVLNVLYNVVHIGLQVELGLPDLLVLLCYVLAIYTSQTILPTKLILLLILVFTTVLGLCLIRFVTAPLNEYSLLFIIPALPMLIALSHGTSKIRDSSFNLYFWSYALPISTAVLYITTYATHLIGILHRLLNYMAYMLCFSLALLVCYSKKYMLGLAIMLSALTTICFFACVTGRLPFLYYWVYSKEDFVLNLFLKSHLVENSIILGDPKFSYMIGFVEPLSITNLTNICDVRATIVFPAEVFHYGYPITPVNYIELDFNVFSCRNLVYTSRKVFLLGLQG